MICRRLALVLALGALVCAAAPAMAAPNGIQALEAEGWDVKVERVVEARAAVVKGEVEDLRFEEFTRLTAAAESGCSFSVECQDDGDATINVDNCSLSQFKKIVAAAADICG